MINDASYQVGDPDRDKVRKGSAEARIPNVLVDRRREATESISNISLYTVLEVTATRTINIGDELFLHYGTAFNWDGVLASMAIAVGGKGGQQGEDDAMIE